MADARFINMARWMGMKDATRPEDFITALSYLEKVCDVNNLRMSDYDIRPEEFDDMAENAIHVMARL